MSRIAVLLILIAYNARSHLVNGSVLLAIPLMSETKNSKDAFSIVVVNQIKQPFEKTMDVMLATPSTLTA
jgi:hypothetical protein